MERATSDMQNSCDSQLSYMIQTLICRLTDHGPLHSTTLIVETWLSHGLSVKFACSSLVLRLPPTIQRHAKKLIGYFKLSV